MGAVVASVGCSSDDAATPARGLTTGSTTAAATTSGSGGAAGSTGSGASGSSATGFGTGTAGNGNATGGQGGGSDAGAGDDAASAVDGVSDDGAPGTMLGDAGSEGDGIIMIARPFTAAPEMSDKAGVAKGQIIRFTMPNSKTFADGTRAVAVYLPAGYVSGTEVPFMVAQDGVAPQSGGSFGLDDLRPLMDNLIAAGKLPAMAGVFVDPASMRGVEYDTVFTSTTTSSKTSFFRLR